MADGHVKVSSVETTIDNRNLAQTLAEMAADDHNNSKNDVQSVEMETNDKKSFQGKSWRPAIARTYLTLACLLTHKKQIMTAK